MFCCLVAYAIICWYWCWPDIVSVACDSPTSCDLYGVWLVVVIVVFLPNNCPMGPWFTIVSLNHYSWPYGNRCKDWWSMIFASFLCCQCTNLLWCSLTLSPPIGFLSMTGITLYTGWLNSNVARLSKPCPSGVVQICNNAMWMSPPESTHFLIVHLMNLMHVLTCPRFWRWYTDDTACLMLSLLQNFLNLSETKLVPASDIILHGIPYSANMTFVVVISLSVDSPSILFIIGNLLW